MTEYEALPWFVMLPLTVLLWALCVLGIGLALYFLRAIWEDEV
jgi:hypothetical protein